MKKISGSRFNLQVRGGEAITVQITNTIGIVDQVVYVFNGADPVLPLGTPYKRTIEKSGMNADPSPSYLSARVTFANANGGSFTITVVGDPTEDTSSYDYEQESEASEQLNYILTIV